MRRVEKIYKQKIAFVQQFIFDMDGVFTNGTALILEGGQIARSVHMRDAYAIARAVENGLNVAVISRGTDETYREKLKMLGVQDVYMGIMDETEAMADLVAIYGWEPHEMLYMGDDIPDLCAMELVGISSCPQDAVPEVRDRVDYISHKKGGEGCIRDVIEQSLKLKGLWAV